MTPDRRTLGLAALPIVGAVVDGTPAGRLDARALVEDLDPDVARALVLVFAGAFADAYRAQGVRDEDIRPLVQAALLGLHAGPPAP